MENQALTDLSEKGGAMLDEFLNRPQSGERINHSPWAPSGRTIKKEEILKRDSSILKRKRRRFLLFCRQLCGFDGKRSPGFPWQREFERMSARSG